MRRHSFLSVLQLSGTALFIAICSANPQAISVTFSNDYIGDDGSWSAVSIRVGQPEQWLSVFPNTVSSETWVAGSNGCDGTSTCAAMRGGVFYKDNSTTWQDLGQYEMGYTQLSSTVETADYGFDNISLSDSIETSNQIIAIVDSVDHWVGNLGLNVQETRFSNDSNHLALISTLVQNNSIIPSHSYGYTAGASYKGRGVPGSLTLGGVDQNRYISNSLWLDLAPGYVPSAILRSFEVSASIQPTGWMNNPIALMTTSQAAAFTIDSSTPYLWLPEAICDNVASALNLTWDSNLELYRFNQTSSSSLKNYNLQFTFRLANDATSSEMIGLGLSFDAFNLQLSYPFPGLFTNYSTEKVAYFPMKRANSAQQYTLGRAFLQEIYITVDYERNVFQLSQAKFPDASASPELISISHAKNSTFPGPGGILTPDGLSTGAKAGIGIGVALAVILLAFSAWFFCFRRKRRKRRNLPGNEKRSQKVGLLSIFSRSTRHSSTTTSSVAELTADRRHPTEMVSDSSNSRFELNGSAPVEMAAAEVAPAFFQERDYTHISQRNDPRLPVELNQPLPRSSVSKDDQRFNPRTTQEDPVPEYTESDQNTSYSHSISPYSPRNPNHPFRDVSDHAISPVTGSGSDRDHLSHTQHARNGGGSTGRAPVSPLQTRSDGVQSHSSTQSGEASQPSSGLRHLSVPADVPERATSRSSRFREDLVENSTRNSASAVDHAQYDDSDTRSRFSWER